MPNAILRAGPFASTADSFISEDDVTPPTIVNKTLPVNCNIRDWSDERWSYLLVTNNSTSPEIVAEYYSRPGGEGVTNVTVDSDEISRQGFPGFFEFEGLYFAYQAAETFTLAGTFVAGGAEGQEDDISFTIKDTGNDVEFFNFNNGTRNISGSYSITLPAAVKPIFISLTFFGGIDPTGRITITGINPA